VRTASPLSDFQALTQNWVVSAVSRDGQETQHPSDHRSDIARLAIMAGV
jgi:hypothetical protein